MTDILLKAASKDVMEAKLAELGLLEYRDDGEGNLVLSPVNRVMVSGFGGVTVPQVWATKPVYDAEGNVTTEGVPDPSYHCNIRDHAGIIRNPEPYSEETNPTGTDWGEVTWIDASTVATPALSFE